jgi:hypothetical protein
LLIQAPPGVIRDGLLPSGAYRPPILQTSAHSSSVTGCTDRRMDVTRLMRDSAGVAFTCFSDTGLGKALTAFRSTRTHGSPGADDADDLQPLVGMVEEPLIPRLHCDHVQLG